MLSLFSDFVTGLLSGPIPLVPPRSRIISWISFWDLFEHNNARLCVVSCPPQPLRVPPHESWFPLSLTKNLPVLCVSVSIYSYRFGPFLLCSSVFPHTNTPIRTHPHPSTPNCILDCPSVSPLSHPCNPSVPSPILVSCMSSLAHPSLPMSPSRVRSCPYTSLHPSTPNHTHLWPFLVCIFTIYHTTSTTLYFVRFDHVYNTHRFRVVRIRFS